MNTKKELTAIVSDIQRFSVHDGPGIRTLVFFKGCPLRCQWCQNPETFIKQRQLIMHKNLCIGCGKCIQSCPQKAVYIENGEIKADKLKCKMCGLCAANCFADALDIIGIEYTVEEVLDIILKDKVFYKHSEGGATLGGGEVTTYSDFASELLRRVKEHHIHTAIETCGYSKWEDLKKVLQYTDLVLYDIKHSNCMLHRKYTGVDNTLILSNLKKTVDYGKRVILRLPLIPGINNDATVLTEIANIAKEYGIKDIHILPFHQMGEDKWSGIGLDYTFKDIDPLSEQQIDQARDILQKKGLCVNIGGTSR